MKSRPSRKTILVRYASFVVFGVAALLLCAVWSTKHFWMTAGSAANDSSVPYESAVWKEPLLLNSNAGPSTAKRALEGQDSQSSAKPGAHGRTAMDQHRAKILNSPYGTAAIEELLQALTEVAGGADVQTILQVIALRKREALPLVREKLRTGEMWEKHMLTKFLRLVPWPETKPELLALATAKTGHWLPRQGAMYALGSLGDASIGNQVVAVLTAADSRPNLQMAAISAIARIGFRDGASAITPFLEHDNIHVRVFATRALAELGEPVNKEFLLSALRNEDYVVRQEASEALWALAGQDITEKLQAVAKSDFNEAVRDGAAQSLLRRELQGRSASEKVAVLQAALEKSERLTALWILRTMLEQGGQAGRTAVSQLTTCDDHLGERARAYLILSSSTDS